MFTAANYDLPRQLPGKLKAAVFFGTPLVLVGCILLIVGIVLSTAFMSLADFKALSFDGTQPRVEGTITAIAETNSRENKRDIYEYTFTFSVGGKTYTGASYLPGVPNHQAGDAVTVEYLPDEPSTARILGMRSGPFGAGMLTFFIEPVIGLTLFLIGARRARKQLHLLRNGLLTRGEVTGKDPTSTKINGRRVYAVHFRFTVNGTEHRATARTHHPERLLDEKQEALVYDPNKPGDAVLLDALPKRVRKYFEGVEN